MFNCHGIELYDPLLFGDSSYRGKRAIGAKTSEVVIIYAWCAALTPQNLSCVSLFCRHDRKNLEYFQ